MTELSLSSKKDNKIHKNKEITKPNFWTEEEDKILKVKAEEFKYKNWNSIANFIPGRTSIQCSARYRRIKPGLIKGAWDKNEDDKLLSLYEKYGKNWAAISKEMPHRTGKQIRDRFLNSLDTKFERGKFTEEEDQTIIKYYKIYGNSWAKIAKKLKTRTGDMVKNRFYSSLKKTTFKNRSLLKRKRERKGNIKKISERNKNSDNNILNEQKNLTNIAQETIDKKEKRKKKKKEKKDKKQKIEKQKISNLMENIKDTVQEIDELNNQKNKTNNNISTNIISNESNSLNLDNIDNKNNKISFKNNIENNINDLNINLDSKNSLNNKEIKKDFKIENDNNNEILNLDENNKKNEIANNPKINNNIKTNSNLFDEINDNTNNNIITLNQKDEVDERLDRLKKIPKYELEYKQNLKEQLDIIFDLENIINQKLNSVQKELENN